MRRAEWGNLWLSLLHPHRNIFLTVETWEVKSSNILRAEIKAHCIIASFQTCSPKEVIQLLKGSAQHLFPKTAGDSSPQQLLLCCHLFPHKTGTKHQRWLLPSPCRSAYDLQYYITPGQGHRGRVRGIDPAIKQQGLSTVELKKWPRSATSRIQSTLLIFWELTGF